MFNASPLTSRYKMLQKADENECDKSQDINGRQTELDQIYHQIVTQPILDLADAADRLAFAEEYDYKEASNVIKTVSGALLSLHHKIVTTMALHAAAEHHRHGPVEDQDGPHSFE